MRLNTKEELKNKQHIRFLRLYQSVHEPFERFCRVRVYGEMEPSDLVHETLLIAFDKFDNLKKEESFLSFLCGISLRILANANRKMRPENREILEDLSTQMEEGTDMRTEHRLLYEALACLPTDQKEAIILFEISGFKIKEIAIIQEVSEDAVKQRLHRGRKRLLEILSFESAYKTGTETL